MGGEYLPERTQGEVEIARIVLQSTLMDVFSLCARWSEGTYHYRLVDEHESVIKLCRKSSKQTLTLGQAIEIIETAESDELPIGECGLVSYWWDQQLFNGDDPEDCVAWATVESELYPDLPTWYEQRGRAWAAAAVACQYESGCE